ncbi:hypothetical protein ACGGZK_05425 [Agromyces sp. MMS24-K17]|uniref:hypothetical protein n=1 Tax=Agromyces sp. MMS24-K17 TaxID=3372850 RepID=UPI00375494A1
MGTFSGADVERLRALAAEFDRAADRLDAGRREVGEGIRINAWAGPVAVRFRIDWDSAHSKRMHAAAARLRDGGARLRADAAEQDRASAVGGIRSGDFGGAPERPADYIRSLHEMDRDGDSVRIQRVLCDDGTVRYLVYINGTNFGSDGQTGLDDNANLISGLPDDTLDHVRTEILKAIDGDPDAELMLVGYSQGGLVAQRLADEGVLNISTIATYGSPSYKSYNSLHGAEIIRFEHNGDPIPLTDAEVGPYGWLRGVQAEQRGGSDVTFRGGNPLQTIVGGFPHTDHGDYEWLADRFEESDDPAHQAIREQMSRFRGRVVGDSDREG